MKKLSALVLMFCSLISNGQELPTNKQSGLISLTDSVVAPKSFDLNTYKKTLADWLSYISVQNEAEKIFNYDGIKDIILFVSDGAIQTESINKPAFQGKMIYSGKIKRLGMLIPNSFSGEVAYTLYYYIRNGRMIYEFTQFEFVNMNNDLLREKFENERVTNKNVFEKDAFANNKKLWLDLKNNYIDRFKILAGNLKMYLESNINSSNLNNDDDPINYNNYKIIKENMSYDKVVEILKDEGRELSLTSTKNGTERIIKWKGKVSNQITITFLNDKVVTKMQANL